MLVLGVVVVVENAIERSQNNTRTIIKLDVNLDSDLNDIDRDDDDDDDDDDLSSSISGGCVMRI